MLIYEHTNFLDWTFLLKFGYDEIVALITFIEDQGQTFLVIETVSTKMST